MDTFQMQNNYIQFLENQLSFQEFKISSLLEITNAINSKQSVDTLTKIIHFVLKEQLFYSKFVLFYKSKNWEPILKVGVKGTIKEEDILPNLSRFNEITFIDSSPSDIISQFDCIVPVNHHKKPIAYLLLSGGNDKITTTQERLSNMKFVQTLINIVIVAIENQKIEDFNIKQIQLKKELEVASELQKMLFPSELPKNNKLDFSAKHTSRHEVGGDYYDYIPINEEEIILCIADVSGKGISAALLMANFQATIRALLQYQDFELDFLIEELNKKVIKNAKGEKFITFFIAHYNIISRKLTYINAGHNAPFITNGKELISLDKGTVGLGMFEDLPFINVGKHQIEPNSTLIMYTDGVIELENSKNEFFEIEQLIKIVHQYYPLSMEDLNNLIFSKLDEWRGEKRFVDDTAIFCCRFF
jgi:sigma-B regulation protein RsbU (phosphoserine phosphatase)